MWLQVQSTEQASTVLKKAADKFLINVKHIQMHFPSVVVVIISTTFIMMCICDLPMCCIYAHRMYRIASCGSVPQEKKAILCCWVRSES